MVGSEVGWGAVGGGDGVDILGLFICLGFWFVVILKLLFGGGIVFGGVVLMDELRG